MSNIKAEIIADSINEQGCRLTTYILTYPRIIHAELLTHKMASKNASSSRAVPVAKMIESVKNNMFIPMAFQAAHSGMQGSEYLNGSKLNQAKELWIESAELALAQAEKMQKLGITKQIINRILEPYQYYTSIFTCSESGLLNFFDLRCPQYFENMSNTFCKSKKEYIKIRNEKSKKLFEGECPDMVSIDDWNYKENVVSDFNQELWFQLNEGLAEIHLMELAEKMYDCFNESRPKLLKLNEWHIPFSDKINEYELLKLIPQKLIDDDGWGKEGSEEYRIFKNFLKIKIATARCARVSYTVVGDEDKPFNYGNDIKLHDKLIESKHASPTEHIAINMGNNNWYANAKGFKLYRTILEEEKKLKVYK